MTKTQTDRIRRVITVDPMSSTPSVGETVALVEYRDVMSGQTWNMLDSDPRTNMGRQSLWDGWLGTTNDVSATACGAWRIASLADTGREGRYGETNLTATLIRVDA